MTDTVEVPTALLTELRTSYESTIAAFPASAVARLAALIPGPIKVGDALTAARVSELPPLAVVIDAEGDSWVVCANGDVYLSSEGSSQPQAPTNVYEPYTVVYLPAGD